MKNILVIEDSKVINAILKKELEKLNFTVSQAFCLGDARKFISETKYDLIILDLHLPDGEGSELIADIQSLCETKVVVLTSTQDEDLRQELFHFGILDYIIKDANLVYSIAEIIRVIRMLEDKTAKKILVVDDSRFICRKIEGILKPRNYSVDLAFSAKEGFEKLQQNEYNLLLLDIELPDINGVKVLNLIRKQSRFRSLPIMILSGMMNPETTREVLKYGANDIVKKPFVYEEFVLKVDLWVDYFHKSKELQDKSEKLETINKNLEKLVSQEIDKNRQKDHIMFMQSRQAQMGEVIAMIAHQWRQPLAAISATSSVINLKAKLKKLDLELAFELSKKISDYTQHLSETIDDFRNFFKPDREKKLTSFETVFKRSNTLIEESLKNNKIEIDCDVIKSQEFQSYENELVQVVINIIKNAEDILLEKDIKNPWIKVKIDGKNITISDNAGGVPEKLLDKIFDPYFSTKLSKNGTGLGLYMSRIIIQEHCGGKLVVENCENGALFSIML